MSRDPYDPQQHQIEVLSEISEGIAAIAMLLRDHLAQPAPPLDPDRLARALAAVMQERGGPIEWPDTAAEIVKAYEEEG